MRAIRLAVADDSTFVRMAIARMLRDEPRLQVVGLASSGEELLAKLDEWRPDVITLDLAMPGIGGLGALDRIVAMTTIPVIILSTHAGHGAPQTLEALHRGATDFIDKQKYSLVDFRALREVLIDRVLTVAGRSTPAPQVTAPLPVRDRPRGRLDVVVLGASTGGPPAIERILGDLGAALPVPMVIAQHMPEGFTRAFADRLNGRLQLEVREAHDGEPLVPGRVLIAPAGRHLRLALRPDGARIATLHDEPKDAPNHPSVDELFRSAAAIAGPSAIGILLTGMGRDGAAGLRDLVAAGGLGWIQDRATSVVWGMPGAAAALGFPHEQLALADIGPRLVEVLGG
jgi:two-component system chemotaxis response regulator CheB